MDLVVPDHLLKKISHLNGKDRARIKKRLDDIDYKISVLGLLPCQVIEKRLRGRLHPFLQQRVGGWRLWFREDHVGNVLYLVAVKTKKEAGRGY